MSGFLKSLFILCAASMLMAGCAIDGMRMSDFSDANRTSPDEWRNESEPVPDTPMSYLPPIVKSPETISVEAGTLTYGDYSPSLVNVDYEGLMGANFPVSNLNLSEPPPFEGAEEEEDEEVYEGSGDKTGTDPRDFTSKFMPYYRYTELENEIEIHALTVFGMFAFNPRFAMTYELPVMQHQDYKDWKVYQQLPPGTIEEDTTGMGDLNLRFFLRPEEWEWTFWDGAKSGSVMPVLETTLPTATEDALGGDKWILSPGITLVLDMPFESPPLGLGFIAMMNFYDFDAVSDDDPAFSDPMLNDDQDNDVSRYRGRWFWMQPLSKPAFVDDPNDKKFHVFDTTGLYLLTEAQPVYDFEEDDFSFWIGPELGKILREGVIVYIKPGWGIDNTKGRYSGDRRFSLEFGWRYFF